MRTAILAVLGVLLATNLFNLGRNAEKRPFKYADKATLYSAARDGNSRSVNGTFGIYHYLRARLAPGSVLVLPASLKSHVGLLTAIARVRTEIADEPVEL